jgi:hypothetical protein
MYFKLDTYIYFSSVGDTYTRAHEGVLHLHPVTVQTAATRTCSARSRPWALGDQRVTVSGFKMYDIALNGGRVIDPDTGRDSTVCTHVHTAGCNREQRCGRVVVW